MILNRDDALYAANVFVDYFSNFERIDDYLRKVKLERMENYPTALPGMGPQDEMFSDFSMNPEDMEFECREVDNETFMYYLEVVTSHAIESSIPGKSLRYIVYEKNTNKIVGFIRMGSPTINSKPRNEFLGKPLDTLNREVMKRFNDSAIMGFIIVPTQPFGFNYLGGKLLAAICCSHLVKYKLDEKYGGPFCMFETTSLYGSTKGASQYDGMKPFLRYKGNTDSDFAPLINDENYRRLSDWFVKRNNGESLVPEDASSRKLKTQTKMISIIKASLKEFDKKELDNFNLICNNAKGLTEKKRQYMSDFGFENVKEYLNMETDTLIKKDNYDRYSFDGVVSWWKDKAVKRFESLKNDSRLRSEIEVWNHNSESIDIIR
jgi:hypothetical protein